MPPAPALWQSFRITNSGNQRTGREWADAGYLSQLFAEFVASELLFKFFVQGKHLLVEFLQVLGQSINQSPHGAGQAVLGIFQYVRHALADIADPLRYDQTVFTEQSTYLIALCSARLDKSLSRPMQRRHGLLFHVLGWHEAHVGTRDRFANRFGITCIVLVALHIRLHELWCHQFDSVTVLHQLARPVVRATAGFHANQAGFKVGKVRQHLAALQGTAHHWLVVRIHAVYLKDVLCQINANRSNLHTWTPTVLPSFQ